MMVLGKRCATFTSSKSHDFTHKARLNSEYKSLGHLTLYFTNKMHSFIKRLRKPDAVAR